MCASVFTWHGAMPAWVSDINLSLICECLEMMLEIQLVGKVEPPSFISDCFYEPPLWHWHVVLLYLLTWKRRSGEAQLLLLLLLKKKRQAIKLSAASHRRVKFIFCFDVFIMIKRVETGYAKTPIKLITKLYLSVFLGWIYAENHFAVLHCPLRWQP